MNVSGQVCLRRGEESRVRGGAPWIFENELDWADDTCEKGGLVDVLDSRLRFAARGFWNPDSKICVRVLTRDADETIDREFFRRRLLRAWEYRRSLGFADSCRVVFGESDGLPGLTVDKFADCLSFQITSLGMERWKEELIGLLAEIFSPRGIYERNDVPVREKEGLAQTTGCVYGSVPEELEIREHDARMLVSIRNGQKTGHFLDQQENRGRIRPYCAGRTRSTCAAARAASPSTPRSMAPKASRPWTFRRRRLRSCAKTRPSTAWRIRSRRPASTSLISRGNIPMPGGSTAL